MTSTTAKQEPDHPSVRGGMYAAPIVSRCVHPATGALGTLQSGELGMLGRGDYLIRYKALGDQDCWRGPGCEADWAGVEQNADKAVGLPLDTLRGEAFIDRARTPPLPKLQAALAQRRATALLTVDFSSQERSASTRFRPPAGAAPWRWPHTAPPPRPTARARSRAPSVGEWQER